MLGNLRTIDRHLLTRRCVKCGYDGASVNRSHTGRCPRCGCDLVQRPPRSYAEMEGLLGLPDLQPPPRRDIDEVAHRQRTERLVHRWLAFLFLAMLGLLALAYLSAAAMDI